MLNIPLPGAKDFKMSAMQHADACQSEMGGYWEGDVLKSCNSVAEQATMVRVHDHKIRDVAE